jgi:hypothetical protein
VPFTQLGSVGAQYQRRMGKDRLFPSEGIIYQYLLGGIGQMVFSPYHMGYTHEVVIYHNRKVIGGHAIGLLYYHIAKAKGWIYTNNILID